MQKLPTRWGISLPNRGALFGLTDVDELIECNAVGTSIHEFSADAYVQSLSRVDQLNGISEKCRKVAADEFDLARIGGARYRRLYHRMLM